MEARNVFYLDDYARVKGYRLIEIEEGKVELAIPDEVHRLLTRALNHYIFKFSDEVVRDILQGIREEMISGGWVNPLFRLHEVLVYLNNAVMFNDRELETLCSLASAIHEIAEREGIEELADYVNNYVINPPMVNILFRIYVKKFLFLKQPARYAHITFYKVKDSSLHSILFETQADSEGIFTLKIVKLMPYALYIRYKDFYSVVKEIALADKEVELPLKKL